MKRILLLSLLVLTIGCAQKKPVTYPVSANPYLPLWEHVPDGEPRVFEDPDNPGSYRIYLTGSHDLRYDSYCGADVRQWSAPVDDLSDWRDEGPVFTYQENGNLSIIYAPDIVEVRRRDDGSRKYYLYPHALMRMPMVAVGDRPDGPFVPVNCTEGRISPGSCIGFDPGVLVEQVDDPSDPDYETGYRAYVAWGIHRSSFTELDQNTMYSPRHDKVDYPLWMPSQFTLMLSRMSDEELPEEVRHFRRWGGLSNAELPLKFPAVAEGETLDDFGFYEASSFRRVGNKYLYIYSGASGPEYGLGLSNSTLRYAYADNPTGPWKSGGVLVDARGPVLSKDGSTIRSSFGSNNTHGSLELINGQWYVFYHRAPRSFGFARQGMVAPVCVEVDDKPVSEGGEVRITAYDPYRGGFTLKADDGSEYTGAEVTSEGFNMFGLDPYNYYSAGYACYMSRPETMQDNWDIWDNRMDITDMRSGDVLGFKYFGFDGLGNNRHGLRKYGRWKSGSSFNLFLRPRTKEAFKVEVWMDAPWKNDVHEGIMVAEVNVPAGMSEEMTRFTVPVDQSMDRLKGKHALYLVVEGPDNENLCDIIGLGFTRKGTTMDFPAVPEILLSVDGMPIDVPEYPVRSTDYNDIMGYDRYEINLPAGKEIPVVSATSTMPGVDIAITQAQQPDGTALVSCTWNGVTKTYSVCFDQHI